MKTASDEQLETLATVLSDVLEAAAFSFADVCPKDELPDVTGEVLQAEITFSGSGEQGTIRLAGPPEVAATFAAEMLALDPDELTEEQAADALKELLNVTCGQWLTTVWGQEPLFQLSVPRLSRLDRQNWQNLCNDEATQTLLVDDLPLACALGFEGRETL